MLGHLHTAPDPSTPLLTGHLPSLPVPAAALVPLNHPVLGDLAASALQLERRVLPQPMPLPDSGGGDGAPASGVISSQVGAAGGEL